MRPGSGSGWKWHLSEIATFKLVIMWQGTLNLPSDKSVYDWNGMVEKEIVVKIREVGQR
jgi:hypothetical protein